jgi:hypothetical protein
MTQMAADANCHEGSKTRRRKIIHPECPRLGRGELGGEKNRIGYPKLSRAEPLSRRVKIITGATVAVLKNISPPWRGRGWVILFPSLEG